MWRRPPPKAPTFFESGYSQTSAGIMVLMPSDHAIKDEPGFAAAVLRAAEVAVTGKLVLFGISPSAPPHHRTSPGCSA